MKEFSFYRQDSIGLYRKWYLLEKKEISKKYDLQQILDLKELIQNQTHDLITFYCNQEDESFTAKFPILHINGDNFKKIIIDLFIIKNTIECLNMPGCMVEGDNLQEAFSNLILAATTCANARFTRGLYFTNRVFLMHTYPAHTPIESEQLITDFKKEGWVDEYINDLYTVLLKENNPISFTIPNSIELSGSLHFAYKRYLFRISGKTYHELYT